MHASSDHKVIARLVRRLAPFAFLAIALTASPAKAESSMAVSPAPNEAAPRSEARKPRFYAGGGGLYLPIDKGLAAAAAYAGLAVIGSENLDGGVGVRIGYGESRYSSAVVFTPEAHVYRWWGAFGIGIAGGVGLIVASRKGTSGWDGALAGVMTTASPVRLRFGPIEPSLDVGILYAVGESYVAPFVMPSLTGRF